MLNVNDDLRKYEHHDSVRSIVEVLQKKASAALSAIKKSSESTNMELGVEEVNVGIKAYACQMHADGSFFVVTGTRDNPAGFGTRDYEFVFIYREEANYGVFVAASTIMKIIRENKAILKIGIDEKYQKMGVYLNAGILINYLDEDFLSALPPSSERDSSTDSP